MNFYFILLKSVFRTSPNSPAPVAEANESFPLKLKRSYFPSNQQLIASGEVKCVINVCLDSEGKGDHF